MNEIKLMSSKNQGENLILNNTIYLISILRNIFFLGVSFGSPWRGVFLYWGGGGSEFGKKCRLFVWISMYVESYGVPTFLCWVGTPSVRDSDLVTWSNFVVRFLFCSHLVGSSSCS